MERKEYNLSHIVVRLLNEEDKNTLIDNFKKSKSKNLSSFVRDKLLDKKFKVVYVDENLEDIKEEIKDISFHIQKIGINYNQAVKVLNQQKRDNASNDLTKELISLTESLFDKVNKISKLINDL